MTKQTRALALACFVFLSSVMPVRQSYAVVPLVGMAVALIGEAGAVVVADALSASVAALIGGTIVALAITPSTADAPVRVPLLSDQPIIDAAIPPPSAPATAQSQPGGYKDLSGPLETGGQWYASKCAISAAGGFHVSNQEYAFTYCNEGTPGAAGWEYCWEQISTGTPGCQSRTAYQVAQDVVCPAGYVSSGSNCVLQTPRVAVPDGKADVPRTSSGYQAPTSATEADALPSYAQVSNGTVYASGKNSAGQPVMIQYSVSPDGTKTYVTHYTQSEVGGQSVVNTQTLTVDAATGRVLSGNASSAQGSISGAGTSAVPSVSTGAAVTPGAATDIVFPTDYARAGEAAAAAGSINARIDANAQTIKDAIVSQSDISSASQADPVVPTDQELRDVMFKDTFTPLLSWSIPAHASQCPTADLSFTMFGHYTPLILDAHCTIFEMPNVRSVLSVVMDVVWSVVALFILLGA